MATKRELRQTIKRQDEVIRTYQQTQLTFDVDDLHLLRASLLELLMVVQMHGADPLANVDVLGGRQLGGAPSGLPKVSLWLKPGGKALMFNG